VERSGRGAQRCCIALVQAENERDAARQSRKRLVALFGYWRASAKDWKECFRGVEETLTEAERDRDYYREALAKADVEMTQLRARAEQAEAERDDLRAAMEDDLK